MIRINERYGIEVGEMSYTLVRFQLAKTGKKKGEELTRPLGYYKSLRQTLEAFADKYVTDALKDGDMTLETAVNTIVEAHKEVVDIIKQAIPKVKVVLDDA